MNLKLDEIVSRYRIKYHTSACKILELIVEKPISFEEIKQKLNHIPRSSLRKAKNELRKAGLIKEENGLLKPSRKLEREVNGAEIAVADDEAFSTEEKIELFLRKVCKKEINHIKYVENKGFLEIDFEKLKLFDRFLAEDFLENPEEMISLTEDVLNRMLSLESPKYEKKVRIHVKNIKRRLSIEEISAEHLYKLWEIDGIVRRVSDQYIRITVAVFECRSCGERISVHQERVGDITKPQQCPNCGKKTFSLLKKESEKIDFQRIVIQDNYTLDTKQLAVYLFGAHVNKVKLGEKIRVVGVLKELYKGGRGEYYVDCYGLEVLEKSFEEIEITPEDERRIKEFAEKEDVIEVFKKCIAPHIAGMDEIKEAVVYYLFGAPPKILPDGERIRGDIHILLVGEPSTGKTDILKSVVRISPKSVMVSGGTATGPGLTLTVRKNEFGSYEIEGGAMVLGDMGHTVIDEFDKIKKDHYPYLLDGMEKQQIFFAKAGIIANPYTRTGILAAANPKDNKWDDYKTFTEQVTIPATILSRFDLIFPIKNELKRTKKAADRVFDTYKGRNLDFPITVEFLRKYIAYARQNINPELSDEAEEYLKEFFEKANEEAVMLGMPPLYIRQLISLIRITLARARARLSRVATKEDAERAVHLMSYYLKSIGIDPETGRIDVDIIFTGATKSQRERARIVEKIIRDLEKTYGEARFEEIVNEAERYGLKVEDVERAIELLKRDSRIFEPKEGVYRAL